MQSEKRLWGGGLRCAENSVGKVAGREMPGTQFKHRRLFNCALVLFVGTTGVKATTRGRIHWTGHITVENNSFLIFLWLHLILLCSMAVIVLIPPIRRRILESETPWVWVFFIAFSGTMSDQITGSFFFQAVSAPILFGGYLPAEIWIIIAFIYPIERLIIAIATTIIGVVVIRALREIGFTTDQQSIT